MKEPKISLVIPAYNEEKYIGDCLDYAIKHAGSKFFEIIVIDNGSTDNTKAEAEKRRGVRVVHEKEKGLTRARQRGLIEANGDIIAYIDADTRMHKDWIHHVIGEFQKDPNLACLSGPYEYFDIPKWRKVCVKIYWYILGLPSYFVTKYMITGGNFAIRKDVLHKMNGFDTSIEFYGEDTNIARRAHKFGKVKFKLAMVMPISGRRINGQGMFTTMFIYVANFVSEAVIHRPVTKKYVDIR
jgi:glycosyltransferase involved in cell wall biosynthesis